MKANHINYSNANTNFVYCRKLNKVLPLQETPCSQDLHCSRFNGSAQGQGVECLWEDPLAKHPIAEVWLPLVEQERVNKLIKDGELDG